MKINIVLFSICCILHWGSVYPLAQESKFVIRLKSGVEIKTDKILIEDDVVYYLFSSHHKKNVGIDKSTIEEIREKRSGKEIIVLPSEANSTSRSAN